MEFQIAKENELEEILELQYLAYQTEAALFGTNDIPPLKQTLEEVKAEFRDGTIIIVKDGSKIIGSVRMKEKDNTVYIGKLMVHPDYRRKGIGSSLLSEVEKIYPHRRYELFTSTRSVDNIRLYKSLGYKIFDEKDITEDITFVYLEKV